MLCALGFVLWWRKTRNIEAAQQADLLLAHTHTHTGPDRPTGRIDTGVSPATLFIRLVKLRDPGFLRAGKNVSLDAKVPGLNRFPKPRSGWTGTGRARCVFDCGNTMSNHSLSRRTGKPPCFHKARIVPTGVGRDRSPGASLA